MIGITNGVNLFCLWMGLAPFKKLFDGIKFEEGGLAPHEWFVAISKTLL